jgi:hypothetical protein
LIEFPGSAQQSSADDIMHRFTVIQKQWKCNDKNCEEAVTKCTNNICDTTRSNFNADSYQPEIPKIQLPDLPVLPNFQEIFRFAQFPQFPVFDFKLPFDKSGLVELVANPKDLSSYYWSNSKQFSKNCHDNKCVVISRSCTNGKCEEKTENEAI